MSFFKNMNTKLDLGWKLTNVNCDKCKQSLLIEPSTKFLYCPKCNFQTSEAVKIIEEEQEAEQQMDDQNKNYLDLEQDVQDLFNKPTQSDLYSKKLSQKLLQGWAMLEEVCDGCLLPIMKSKKGIKICVGCEDKKEQASNEKFFSHQDQAQQQQSKGAQQKPQQQDKNIQETQQITQKQVVKNQQEVQSQSKSLVQQIQLNYEAQTKQYSDSLLKISNYYYQKLDQAIQNDNVQQFEEISEKLGLLKSQQEKVYAEILQSQK